MLASDVIERLRGFAQEVSEREGCILYDLEFVGHGGNRTLRVFIDIDEEGRSVSIDDCANVSRGLSLLLDVEDIVPGNKYELEVSSPGLERSLTQTWHFQKFVGHVIEIKSNAPITIPEELASQKKGPVRGLRGQLRSADEEKIVLLDKEVEWTVEREIVHKAKLIYEFAQPGEKKSLGKKGKKQKKNKKR